MALATWPSITPPAYRALAVAVLIVHLLWIAWVILGVLVARHRPALRFLHIVSLVYGIFIEVVPWLPCPLTNAEQWFEARGGVEPYHGPFLVHYLDALIYPNVPVMLLIICAVAVCAGNLGVYVYRYRRRDAAGW
jgi:hypothetical protein